jgi:hypothetical protein
VLKINAAVERNNGNAIGASFELLTWEWRLLLLSVCSENTVEWGAQETEDKANPSC